VFGIGSTTQIIIMQFSQLGGNIDCTSNPAKMTNSKTTEGKKAEGGGGNFEDDGNWRD
jgi:hypothetical protein